MAWSDMEPKQKGMLVAVIVIFIIIGYMVYKLFFAGSSASMPPEAAPVVAQATPPAATPATPPAAAPAANTNNAGADLAVADNTQPGAMPNAMQPAAANAAPQVVEMPKRELTPEELALLEERRQVQQQYLQLVNQYQLMEMQNKVATSQSTLIKTQIDTAKSEQQASRLGLVLPGQEQDNTDKTLKGVALVYVGQKDGVWNAVLNLRGNYVTVKLGSRLPDDSLVSKITENSIVLYKDGERRTLMVPMVVDHDTSDENDTDTNGANGAGGGANGGNNGGATGTNTANGNDTGSSDTGN